MSRFSGVEMTKVTMNAKEKRITLKEAAEMSGYTPDYLGQLIRKGKLPGEQIYANVAWVTTESAVRDYLDNTKKGVQSKATGSTRKMSTDDVSRLYRLFSYGVIAIISLFLVFLFFLFSVQIEKKMHERTIDQVTGSNITTAP